MKKTIRRNPNLRYNKPQLLRLEPRIMFDGAAVDTTVDVAGGHDGGSMDPAMEQIQQAMDQSFGAAATQGQQDTESNNQGEAIDNANGDLPDASADIPLLELTGGSEAQQQLLSDAAQLANAKLVDWVNSDDFRAQAAEIFSADANSAAWEAQLDALRESIINGTYSIRVEIRTNEEMQNLLGAFSATGTTGQPTIYMNANFLASADANQVSQVLIEEIGHAIDNQLNSGLDSQGDEGHAFAALLITGDANLANNQAKIDHHSLTIDGQQVAIEAAGIATTLVQEHLIPMSEAELQKSFKGIYSSASGTIETVIAISATGNKTVVVYDHWEDGYEANPESGLSGTTKVWGYDNGVWFNDLNGDGTQQAGETTLTVGGGIASIDGATIVLRNSVNPSSPLTLDYDGRDRILSNKAISVTRAGWSSNPGTVLAGAVNLIDSANAGTFYSFPVGQDVDITYKDENGNNIAGPSGSGKNGGLFQYSSAHIIATHDNTEIKIDKDGDGIYETTVTLLKKGDTYLIDGGIKAGGNVMATDPDKGINVYMVAGNKSATYENRWFTLIPDEQWASSYYAPVSTTSATHPTGVVIFNPSDTETITVYFDTAGKTGQFDIAPGKTQGFLMPNSAAHFYTKGDDTNPAPTFYAVGVVDAGASGHATNDWSYSLIPESYLTDRAVVGLGWGDDANATGGSIKHGNYSPVWITPVEKTTIYIEGNIGAGGLAVMKGDGSTVTVTKTTDANGKDVYSFQADKLQTYRIRDADGNQSGLNIYTLDGALITGAWGQDPSGGTPAGAPALDMGSALTPYPDYVLTKDAREVKTVDYGDPNASNDNDDIELGEQVEYKVRLTNRAVIDLYNIRLTDKIEPADSAVYVPDSLTLNVYRPDGTLAWSINQNIQTFYKANGTTVDYTVTLDPGSAMDLSGGVDGSGRFKLDPDYDPDNTGEPGKGGFLITDLDPSTAGVIDGLKRGGVVEFIYRVTVRDDINKTLADADYTVTNSVKMTGGATEDGNDFEKNKENKTTLANPVTDGEVWFIDGEGGDPIDSYEPGNDIWLRVVDGDQSGKGTLTVIVKNTSSGDQETVTLNEVDGQPGTFEGSIETRKGSSGTSGDNRLTIKRGDEIQVEYTDPVSGRDGGVDGVDNPTNWGINGPNYQIGENNNVKTAVVDDSGVSVNDITVNEATGKAVFTITAEPGQQIKLALRDGDGENGKGIATKGDNDPATIDGDTDYINTLEYFDETAQEWKAYTPDSIITVTASGPNAGKLLVRNPVVNDTLYEGAHSYYLDVTPIKSGGAEGGKVTGTATILDDGTGDIYDDKGRKTPLDPSDPYYSVPGNPDYTVRDDDRFPIINNPIVNEGSDYVVFEIKVTPNDTIKGFKFEDGTATGGSGVTSGEITGTATSTDYENDTLEYSLDNGLTWTEVPLSDGGNAFVTGELNILVNKPDGKVLVRTKIQNDDLYEASETFKLTVVTENQKQATGIATIMDDGTGTVWEKDPAYDPETPTTPELIEKPYDPDHPGDDDRIHNITDVTVDNPIVNEGSPFVVFEIATDANAIITGLGLTDGTATGYKFSSGLDPESGDQDYENTKLEYWDGSEWKTLTLTNGTWTAPDNAVVADNNGKLLVRVAIHNDIPYEQSETFDLHVTVEGGKTATGTATIKDDGTGIFWVPGENADPSDPGDPVNPDNPDYEEKLLDPEYPLIPSQNGSHFNDDRPIIINNPVVNEGSDYVVFKIQGEPGVRIYDFKVDNLTAEGGKMTNDGGNPVPSIPTDGTVDYDNYYIEYWDGSSWQGISGGNGNWLLGHSGNGLMGDGIDMPDGELLVRIKIQNDTDYERSEQFTLTAKTSGAETTGTATILDDGTGTIWVENPVDDPDDPDYYPPMIPVQPGETPPEGVDPPTYDNDGPLNPAVTVSNPTVNEASGFVVFDINTNGVSTAITGLTLTNGSATGFDLSDSALDPDSEAQDYDNTYVEYWDGSKWQTLNLTGGAWTGSGVQTDESGNLQVRVTIHNDNPYEGAETFKLKVDISGSDATGTATILDDGTGTIWVPQVPNEPGTPDYSNDDPDENIPLVPVTPETPSVPDIFNDDRIPPALISIDNPSVNEGSEYVVFKVQAPEGIKITDFKFEDGTATGGTGVDIGQEIAGGDLDYENDRLEYSVDGGASWIELHKVGDDWLDDENNEFTGEELDGSGMLVRTKIQNDTLYERSETFSLTVTEEGGNSTTGTATIYDDGTGPGFGENDLEPVNPGPGDDDRDNLLPVKVNNPSVNEASGYVVFKVTTTAGETVTGLEYKDGTANGASAGSGNEYLNGDIDYINDVIEYSVDGGNTWTSGTPGTGLNIKVPDGELLVRTKLVDDLHYERSETFDLKVSVQSGSQATGTATIYDDGTGTVWVPDFPQDPDGKLIEKPYQPENPTGDNTYRNDDRVPRIDDPVVNEGSGYVVFTIETEPFQKITEFWYQDDTATGGAYIDAPTDGSVDYDKTELQYWDADLNGGEWVTISDFDGDGKVELNVPITVDSSGILRVRTKIVNDDNFEQSEQFTLTVKTQNQKTATGTATIKDDGTGKIYDENGNDDPVTPKDDDRNVSVNNPTVNEGSPYIVFEVTGDVGAVVGLELKDNSPVSAHGGSAKTDTEGEVDYQNTKIEYFDPVENKWKTYNPSNKPSVPNDGKLLVRVEIFDDEKYEKSETFTLEAQVGSKAPAVGTGTIKDDGTGDVWEPTDPDHPENGTLVKNPEDFERDDDRGISITHGGSFDGTTHTPQGIREDVKYVFFEIKDVEKNEIIDLELLDGDSNTATHAGFTMEYSTDGGVNWKSYVPGNTSTHPIAPDDGRILVRVDIGTENDTHPEGDEFFNLRASYNSNPGNSATGVGTIRDHDAGLPSIEPNNDNGEEPGHITVSEKGLATDDGSNKNTGTIRITAEEGISTINIGGEDEFSYADLTGFTLGNPSDPINTGTGYVRIIGLEETEENGETIYTLTYTYELHTPQDHGNEELPPQDVIDLEIFDNEGNRNEGSLIVDILDDEPTANADTRGVIAGSTIVVGPDGGVLNHPTTGDKSGADGWAEGGGVVGVKSNFNNDTANPGNALVGQYGTLTLNPDGSFSYKNTSGNSGDKDVFTYTVRDSDGDEKTTTLTITIKPLPNDDTRRGDEDTPVIGNVIKDGGPGDEPDAQSDEHMEVTRIWIGEEFWPVNPGESTVVKLDEGTLTFERDGRYTFVPTPDWNGEVPEITYDVAYGEGATESTATAKLNITIDPVQDAFDDSGITMVSVPITTTVLENDGFSNPDNTVSIEDLPIGGTAVVNPDRSITFTPDSGFTGYASYVYRVTTPEGVWEEATVTIRVDSLPPFVDPGVPGEHLPPYVEPPVPQPEPPTPHLGLDADPEMPPYEVGKDVFDDWDQPQYEYELLLEKKIPDQPLEGGKPMEITIPKDTFRHTDPSAKLTLVAAQLDGSPLPDWLEFDSARGSFSGTPPEGYSGEMLVRVVARDGQGRQVETIVRMGDRVADPDMPPYEAGRDPGMGESEQPREYELLLEKKIPDQPLEEGGDVDFLVPQDTFRHTDPSAKLTLSAAMVDGSPLPEWLKFDANTGSFSGKVPEGQKGELLIKVVAKDEAGRQVETIVRISDQVEPSYAPSVDPGLMVNGLHVLQVAKAVPDLIMPFEADGAASINYVVPMDAFVHTDPNALVELSALMVDGSELPEWLKFDAKTGKFTGVPPKGFKGELQIKVIARDKDGRQAETILRIKIGEQQVEQKGEQKPQAQDKEAKVNRGKPSLTSMLKTQGSWAWKAERDRLVSLAQEADRIKASMNKVG